MIRPPKFCKHDAFHVLVIVFMCVCVWNLTPLGYACYRRSSFEMFVGFRSDGEIKMVGYRSSLERETEDVEPSFIAYPRLGRSERGLIGGYIMLFTRKSFSVENLKIEVRDGRGDLSESEIEVVRRQIIAMAQQDPMLAQYNPGGPTVTRLNPSAVYNLCASSGLVLGIPVYIYMCAFFAFEQMRNERREAGECIHCQYDCKGLQTPICPECGQEHGGVVEHAQRLNGSASYHL